MDIAIIGTGISGLGAAYLLHPHHNITVYEKTARIGGHSRTIDISTPGGDTLVDTGFIVFNKQNYPLLKGLFDHIGVPISKSHMSFGVSINRGWLEYGTQRLFDLFSQKRNILRAPFWFMLADIIRFNKSATTCLAGMQAMTLNEYLTRLNMGAWFRDYYLLAMGGAIWSMPLEQILDFPAETFIRFFNNHGLLTVNNQPQWYTLTHGSRDYINRLTTPFKHRIKTRRGVKRVRRHDTHIDVLDEEGHLKAYDAIVMACHSDQALALLEQPTRQEQSILGAIRYQSNQAIVHSDTSLMPKRRSAWSSWVYLSETKKDSHTSVSLTYWMNNLQPLNTKTPVFVTLNPGHRPDPSLVYDEHCFEHPVFDRSAIEAQQKLDEIQGQARIFYAGAWQRYGFHEDGLLSAVNVAHKLGISPPWSVS